MGLLSAKISDPAFLNAATVSAPRVVVDLYFKGCLHCDNDYPDEVRDNLALAITKLEILGGKSLRFNFKRTEFEPRWHEYATEIYGDNYQPFVELFIGEKSTGEQITVTRRRMLLSELAGRLKDKHDVFSAIAATKM